MWALERACNQISGPQPPRRRLRPPSRHVTSLEPGAVLSYRTQAGTWPLFRVARIDDSRVSVAPILVLLAFAGPRVPRMAKVAKIRDRSARRYLCASGEPRPGSRRPGLALAGS